MLQSDLRFGQHRRSADHIPQLPNVSRPVIGGQRFQSLRRNRHRRSSGEPALFANEASREQGDLPGPCAKGWNLESKSVQSIKEILSKTPGLDVLVQLLVGGGH